mmetsp:Transcript_161375/g.518116  ORF Transcript_161375/g.518116 Transcript_161375/m.518116 type:complete len:205 (+) Transcript_161375:847-1461(+)
MRSFSGPQRFLDMSAHVVHICLRRVLRGRHRGLRRKSYGRSRGGRCCPHCHFRTCPPSWAQLRQQGTFGGSPPPLPRAIVPLPRLRDVAQLSFRAAEGGREHHVFLQVPVLATTAQRPRRRYFWTLAGRAGGAGGARDGSREGSLFAGGVPVVTGRPRCVQRVRCDMAFPFGNPGLGSGRLRSIGSIHECCSEDRCARGGCNVQ